MGSVDVLVPTLDRPEALERALKSVQDVEAAEPGYDLRLQVIDRAAGAHLGPAAARNLAVSQGTGEYLALLDDDDRWLAPRIGAAIEVLRSRPEVVVVGTDASMSSGDRFLTGRMAPGPQDLNHAQLALDCLLCASTVTLRRSDWEAAGGMDESLQRSEDYELWLRLTASGRVAHILPDCGAWIDEQTLGLSSDPVAMAEATLNALERSASVPSDLPHWGHRRSRLQAVLAHGRAREGRGREARRLAWQALRNDPKSSLSWRALLRAACARSEYDQPKS